MNVTERAIAMSKREHQGAAQRPGKRGRNKGGRKKAFKDIKEGLSEDKKKLVEEFAKTFEEDVSGLG